MTVFQAAADTPLTKQENRESLLADDSITHHLLDQAQLHSESQVAFPALSLHTPPATPISSHMELLSALGHGKSSCLWAFTLLLAAKGTLPLYCSENSLPLLLCEGVSRQRQCLSLLCTQNTELVLPSVLLRPSSS